MEVKDKPNGWLLKVPFKAKIQLLISLEPFNQPKHHPKLK